MSAAVLGPDNPVQSLIKELLELPDVPQDWRRIIWDRDLPPAMTLSFQVKGDVFTFFATVTTIGTPYDIALDDLRLEAFFPADDVTRQIWRLCPRLSASLKVVWANCVHTSRSRRSSFNRL